MSSDSHYIGITVRISNFVELGNAEPSMNTSSSVILIDVASFEIVAPAASMRSCFGNDITLILAFVLKLLIARI